MKAKKSLGQNFLKSKDAIRKIIVAGEVKNAENILEIGPGRGVLTQELLKMGAKVTAVEKDDDLFAFLSEKFSAEAQSGQLTLINKDILEFEPEKNGLKQYKIIANIPYNITGAILKKFLTGHQPKTMVLMVQNEVGKRIVARDGKESLLSISVKAYGTPKIVTKVPSRYFSPPPKVDSVVISIKNIDKNAFQGGKVSEEKFWELVHAGFSHKRKILAKNLTQVSKKINWTDTLLTLGLPAKARAEELRFEDWIKLLSNTHNLF
jgi:16S rRNA (adenine1518-N6/adenine1519-N6)-dimethyltransferase